MNGLTILHPLFVSLLPLAAAPILFHFLFRLRKKPHVYSSLMFFQRLDPRLNARRRLREWLILLLRSLLIAALLLALAHPRLLGKGREGTVGLALVIDNSGSMSAHGRDVQTKLQEAVAGAQALLTQVRAQDTAGLVLLVEDPAVLLPADMSSDRAALSRALDSIGPTEASGLPTRALERAVALLEPSSATQFEIHIFTDLQETEWNQPPLQRHVPRQGASVTVHRIATPSATRPNVSLAGVKLPDEKILAGRQVPVRVELANSSGWEAPVQLNWTDDAGRHHLLDVTLPGHTEKTCTAVLDPTVPGLRLARFWVQGDSFEADNHAALAFYCDDKRPVLFLGQRASFGLLPAALSPAADGRLSGLVPVSAPWTGLAQALDQRQPVCVVTTAEDLCAASADASLALRRFVEAGHDLIVVPDTFQTSPPSPIPDWLGVRFDNGRTNQAGFTLLALDKSAAVFNDLRDARGEVALHIVKAYQFYPLLGEKKTLLGLEDGRVLLAERRLEKGRIFVSGVAFDPTWTTLPLKAGFLALAQRMALMGAEAGAVPLTIVAGQPLTFLENAAVQVQALIGAPLDWKGRNLFTLPRSGVYKIHGSRETIVAVRSAEKEGQERFLTGDQVPALGDLPYRVKNFGGPGEMLLGNSKPERSLDLSVPLLLLTLAAWAGESWLANQRAFKPKANAAMPDAARARTPSWST